MRPLARAAGRAARTRRVLVDVFARARLRTVQTNHLILTATSPIVALDRDLLCIAWNWTMEEITGIPADAVLGLPILDCFPILEVNGALQRIEMALAGVITHAGHFYAYAKTNVSVFMRVTRRPIYGAGDDVEGVLTVGQWFRHLVEPFTWPERGERAG